MGAHDAADALTVPTLWRHRHSGTVEVGTSASLLGSLAEDGGSNYTVKSDTVRISFQNLDTAETIYIAPTSSVVSSDAANQGWILGPLDTKTWDWPKQDIDLLYFIASAASTRMRVWEETIGT